MGETHIGGIGMFGPGEYGRNASEGILYVEDLPKAKLVRRSRNYKRQACPKCRHSAYRLRTVTRTLHDVGDLLSGRPRDMVLTYSQHRCPQCNFYFNADMDDIAYPSSHYTLRVVSLAVRLVVEDGLPYRPASWHLWRDHRVFVPWATIQNWVEAAGGKNHNRYKRR